MSIHSCPIAYATLGRTTAGKTTLAKFLCQTLNITYIPEAQIKRLMVENYSISDSLREDLRDASYAESIRITAQILSFGNNVLMDAAFHKTFRRRWFYEAIPEPCAGIFLLYCKCNNISKTEDRILLRKKMPKNAESQADSMDIYRFIDDTFDEPEKELEEIRFPTCLFEINTDLNKIANIITVNTTEQFDQIVLSHRATINEYLNQFR